MIVNMKKKSVKKQPKKQSTNKKYERHEEKKSIITKLMGWIDTTPNNVPFNRRLGAYVLDWIIGGIFLGLPAVFIYGGVTGRDDMFSDLYVFESLGHDGKWAFIAGFLCVLFALFYYVYVPWKIYEGQTLGKRWLKLKVVSVDGSNASLKQLVLRNVVGMFLLESGSLVVCGYIRQMVTLALSFYVDYPWQILGTILFILSAMLVAGTASHRAFHDYIGKTKVIEVNE